MRAEVVTERGVVVSGRTMVCPFPPSVMASNGSFCTRSVGNEQIVMKSIMEEEMRDQKWPIMKSCDSICHEGLTAMSANALSGMNVKRSLSDSESYKKLVARNILMSAPK